MAEPIEMPFEVVTRVGPRNQGQELYVGVNRERKRSAVVAQLKIRAHIRASLPASSTEN